MLIKSESLIGTACGVRHRLDDDELTSLRVFVGRFRNDRARTITEVIVPVGGTEGVVGELDRRIREGITRDA